VIVALISAAILEPLIMYRTLARQKEMRRAAAELTLEGTAAHRAAAGIAITASSTRTAAASAAAPAAAQ
jgi:hypothetical protein